METAVRYKEHTDVSHIQMVVNYQCNKCCSSSCNLRINLPQTTVNFWTSVWELLGGDTLPHSRDYSISAIREQPWELVQWACDTPSQDGMLTRTHNYCTLQCMWRMTRHTLCLWLPSQTLKCYHHLVVPSCIVLWREHVCEQVHSHYMRWWDLLIASLMS